MNPTEFCDLAYHIYKHQKEHRIAAIRSCISRAYYSAFLFARDKAGIRNDSGSLHREVINYYLNIDKTVHNRLKSLKQLRTDADYEMNKTLTERNAETALNSCRQVIEALEK